MSIGRIYALFPKEDYGIIRTEGNRNLYFHRHALKSGQFEKLSAGTEVEYLEEDKPETETLMAVNVKIHSHH